MNPATAEVLTTTPAGASADVDRGVRAARRAFEDGPWPRMERSQRAKVPCAPRPINRWSC